MKKVIAGLFVLMLTLVVCTGIAFAREIARDGRFIAYDNGTVLDTRTNLMWAARDNGRHICSADAKTYCENYRGGGFTDWRMPTQNELLSLIGAGKHYKIFIESFETDIAITELIRVSWCWVWASETRRRDASDDQDVLYHAGQVWLSPGVTSLWLPVRKFEYDASTSADGSGCRGRALPVRNAK